MKAPSKYRIISIEVQSMIDDSPVYGIMIADAIEVIDMDEDHVSACCG
jgi:hypothetical protein